MQHAAAEEENLYPEEEEDNDGHSKEGDGGDLNGLKSGTNPGDRPPSLRQPFALHEQHNAEDSQDRHHQGAGDGQDKGDHDVLLLAQADEPVCIRRDPQGHQDQDGGHAQGQEGVEGDREVLHAIQHLGGVADCWQGGEEEHPDKDGDPDAVPEPRVLAMLLAVLHELWLHLGLLQLHLGLWLLRLQLGQWLWLRHFDFWPAFFLGGLLPPCTLGRVACLPVLDFLISLCVSCLAGAMLLLFGLFACHNVPLPDKFCPFVNLETWVDAPQLGGSDRTTTCLRRKTVATSVKWL